MYANYHTHTLRCGHAEGKDRAYIEAAIQAGIRELGFSDHCPWVTDAEYAQGSRMQPFQAEEYVASLESLRKEYAGEIQIYIGFEAEYFPKAMEEQDKLLHSLPIDYMILGQHFLGEGTYHGYMGCPFSREEWLVQYVDTVIEGIQSGRYLYVAHPDLPNYTGDSQIYMREMKRLCQFLKEQDIPVEVNMLGAIQGRHYPNPDFWKIASKVGNKAIIGIDAHSPKQLETAKEGELLCKEFAKGLVVLESLEKLHVVEG